MLFRSMLVEDFGLARNLMLACAATLVRGDARAALQALAGVAGLAGTQR